MYPKLYVLSSGVQTIKKQKLLSSADKNEDIDIPVPYFLIDLENEKVLIDTGISFDSKSSIAKTRGKTENPIEALSKLGIDKNSIGYIIQTHLHFDHAANTKLFPQAKVIVQLEELKAAYFYDSNLERGYVDKDIKNPSIQWEPIVGMKSLFDNKILILPTPGHTPGHQSVVVKLNNYGPVIIAGDVAPLKENIENNTAPGVASNTKDAYYSILSLKEFANFLNAKIWYGHDPKFFEEIKLAPGCYD
ncbi:N-acyl homoserine lactone hydrolase [Desulfurella amilsii]|uniref:N-acyl homoserine lactone hydrolase n=1 Tax=Desulfurella amilsii TaxID=1562698 RepID=A0A1X4XU63_9BACT|nr:N-acyl homoserine lactonase family protein [Desulfurella amilsii]OSS41094.1 N-acyl homoserine lactone hydrolase [Desulfurella amilsii]